MPNDENSSKYEQGKSVNSKIFATICISIGILGCIRQKNASEVKFWPHETRNETVPDYIRKSTVYISYGHGLQTRCTGTYAEYPWGKGVMAAGHCVLDKGKLLSTTFLICYGNGPVKLAYPADPRGLYTPCKLAVAAKYRDDKEFDFAFLRFMDDIPEGLIPAQIEMRPTFQVGSKLEAAGYGDAPDGVETNKLPLTEETKTLWTQKQQEYSGDRQICFNHDFCNEAGQLLVAPKISIEQRFHLQGGSMVVKSMGHFWNKHIVTLEQTDPAGSLSTVGDSGCGWWFNKKMVGVHYGGISNQSGKESYFRTLSYYESQFKNENSQ
jgi:hypothetical protein